MLLWMLQELPLEMVQNDVSLMYRKGEENMHAEKMEIESCKIDGVKF